MLQNFVVAPMSTRKNSVEEGFAALRSGGNLWLARSTQQVATMRTSHGPTRWLCVRVAVCLHAHARVKLRSKTTNTTTQACTFSAKGKALMSLGGNGEESGQLPQADTTFPLTAMETSGGRRGRRTSLCRLLPLPDFQLPSSSSADGG